MTWLRELVHDAMPAEVPAARRRPTSHGGIERELAVIEEKDFPGYFLIVHDIVQYARSRAASSARAAARPRTRRSATCSASPRSTRSSTTCRSSGSCRACATRSPTSTSTSTPTAARRSSSTSTRKYGRRNAAQVANVITYRPKNAVRDMAKALGHSHRPAGRLVEAGRAVGRRSPTSDDHDIPAAVVELAEQVLEVPAAPRHPLRRHGAHRPPGRRGRADRARPDGRTAPCCSGTRTTAPGWGW